MALRDIVSRSAEEGQRDSWEEGNRFEGGLEEEKEGRRGSGESSGHATNANPLCVGADRCHSPLTYPNLGSGTETDHSSPPPPPPRCTLALCPFILFFFLGFSRPSLTNLLRQTDFDPPSRVGLDPFR